MEWILGTAVYVVGWLVTCRVLVRYFPDDFRRDGPVLLGFYALFWPAIAVIGLFALPVWLVTRDLR